MFVHRDEIDLYWKFLNIPFNMIKIMYYKIIACIPLSLNADLNSKIKYDVYE